MHVSLYRKYRPQKFSEVVGQNIIKTILHNEVAMGKASHAYLFSGPRGIGKTSIARILSKAVNCLKRKGDDGEPCDSCKLCININEGKCFDVLEIDAASHTGVDNVRENIIENVRFAPSEAKYKVFIIDEVHMLSKGAFNALLKTLEEPPENSIFILATTEVYKVPPTILSRCEHFVFKKIKKSELAERLLSIAKNEGVKIGKEVAFAVADHAEGSLRDAESILGQLISTLGEDGEVTLSEAELIIPRSNRTLVLEFYAFLSKRNTPELLRLINRLGEDGVDLDRFYNDCIGVGRELVFALAGVEQETTDLIGDDAVKLKETAKEIGQRDLLNFLDKLLEKKNFIRLSPVPQLPLELAVLEFCETRENTRIGTTSQNLHIGTGQAQMSARGPLRENASEASGLALGGKDETANINKKTDIQNELKTKEGVAQEQQQFSSLTIERLKNGWGDFLDKISAENPSLSLLLRLSGPVGLVDNIVKIGVKYRFHREKLNEFKTRVVVEKFLHEAFNAPIKIETVISDVEEIIISNNGTDAAALSRSSEKETNDTQTSLVQNILNEFGGRIVG